MKIIAFIVLLLMVSCSTVKVYRFGNKTDVDICHEFVNNVFIVCAGKENTGYFSEIVKDKIVSYLNHVGYKAYPEESKIWKEVTKASDLPRYLIWFSCVSDLEIKKSYYLKYEPGTTVSHSGSIYSYSGGYSSYSGSSTTKGKLSNVPYSYNIHNANLTIFVIDMKSKEPNKTVWTARAFFSGEKAKFIEQAADYLIPAAFDRFGKPIEGMAEEYEFTGDEDAIKFLKNLNKCEKIIKRH